LEPGGVDRVGVGDQVLEPVVGNLGDLDERSGVLLGGTVAHPGPPALEYVVAIQVVADAHDEWEAEPLAVGRGQLAEGLAVLLAQLRQAVAALVGHRVLAGRAIEDLLAGQVRVAAHQVPLLPLGRPEQRLLERDPKVLRVLERALSVGVANHPVRPLEESSEGGLKLVLGHVVDLAEPDRAGGRRPSDRSAPVGADVVEDDVEQDGTDAAEGDPAAEEDLCPVGDRGGDVGLGGDEHGQPDRRRHDDDVAVVVEVDPGEGLDAHDRDGCEHRQGCATEHWSRDPGDHGGRLWQQAQDDHDRAG
jgi:hypothetical protein